MKKICKPYFVIRRGPTERPYMTELGPRGVQEWCHMKRRELCVFSPDLQPPPIRRFTPGQVTQDLLHLMIGIPSHLFVINKVRTNSIGFPSHLCQALKMPHLSNHPRPPKMETKSASNEFK